VQKMLNGFRILADSRGSDGVHYGAETRKEVVGLEQVSQVLEQTFELGEGCMWDQETESLYFVDITGCRIYRYRPEDGALSSYSTRGPVGCVFPTADHGIGAASGNSLIRLEKDLTGERILATLDFPGYLRFNDGKCDPWGRLWVGTMAGDQSHLMAKGGGSLYCIRDGQILAEHGGFTIPNGLAWSQDRSRFYHIDTGLRRVDVYELDGPERMSGRQTAFSIPEGEGDPDGMCMDSRGNLWIAMWGAGKAALYDPATGRRLEEIPIPAKNVSCVAFGDRDLKTLYITTARDQSGDGGALYRVKLPVGGPAPYAYGGTENGK